MCVHIVSATLYGPSGRKKKLPRWSFTHKETNGHLRPRAGAFRTSWHSGFEQQSARKVYNVTRSLLHRFLSIPAHEEGGKNVMEETPALAHCVIASLLRHANRPRKHCVVNGRRVQRLRSCNSPRTVSVSVGRTCTANRAAGS